MPEGSELRAALFLHLDNARVFARIDFGGTPGGYDLSQAVLSLLSYTGSSTRTGGFHGAQVDRRHNPTTRGGARQSVADSAQKICSRDSALFPRAQRGDGLSIRG